METTVVSTEVLLDDIREGKIVDLGTVRLIWLYNEDGDLQLFVHEEAG